MKDFFNKNDVYLHKAKLFLTVFLVLMSIVIGLFAVYMFVLKAIWLGIGIIIGGIVGLIIFDFIVKLLLSFLVDIKLIRNKLYEQKSETDENSAEAQNYNESLKTFYQD